MINKNNHIVIYLLIIILLISIIITISIGVSSISFNEIITIFFSKIRGETSKSITEQKENIVWFIRLPRVIMSVLIGSALSISGVAMQGLFRNPLADPSIIGISSGAALFTAIGIVLFGNVLNELNWIGISALSIVSFLGAVITMLVIIRLSINKGVTKIATMLLAGIAVNALAGAGTGLLTYLSTEEQLRSLTFWTLGSLGSANWLNVFIMTFLCLISFILISKQFKALNALSLGEKEAVFIGLDIEKLKKIIIITTALLVGVSVAFCGIIGFIGLVVPHIVRLMGISNHKFLIPASMLFGAILMNWTDTLSRTIVMPAELPIGIITALIGAPIFLFLLIKQKKF